MKNINTTPITTTSASLTDGKAITINVTITFNSNGDVICTTTEQKPNQQPKTIDRITKETNTVASLAAQIKAFRKAEGLSRAEFARILHINYNYLGTLESGKIKRSPSFLCQLYKCYLRQSLEPFFGNTL